MKRTKMDLSEERRILAQMIVDSNFLTQLRGIGEAQLFESPFARSVAGWVWEFFTAHSEAPGQLIQDIYLRKRTELQDEEELELVADFLRALSQDWSRGQVHNVDYSVNHALTYFKLQALKQMRERLDGAIEAKDAAGAEQVVGEFKRVERVQGQGIRLFHDAAAIQDAFNREHELLFTFPGDLGEAIGPFCRGDFAAFAAPPKRGKSWWLWFAAYRAAMSGLKAVFVSLEMTKPQVIRRSWSCFAGLPEREGPITLPFFTEDGGVDWREEHRAGVDTTLSGIRKTQEAYRRACRGGEPRLEIYPSGGASVRDLEVMLDNMEYYEDWLPDVLVVDYADLMKAEDPKLEYRHKLDHIWKRLRGLAQDRNILVITASQLNPKEALGDKDATEKQISEDGRKLAHVTQLILLNQSEDEKAHGIIRLSMKLQRDGASRHDQVVVLENRSIGRPYLDSRFRKQVHSDLIKE